MTTLLRPTGACCVRSTVGRLLRRGRRCAGATSTGSPSGSRLASPGQPDVVEDRARVRRPVQRPPARAPARHRLRLRHLRRRRLRRRDQPVVGPARTVPERLRRLLDRRDAAPGNGYMPEALVVLARLRVRGAAAAPAADRDHPAQQAEPAGRREARPPRRGHRRCATSRSTAVWEDHVRYAITAEEWDERATSSSPPGSTDQLFLVAADPLLHGGQALGEGRLTDRPDLGLELAVDGVVVRVDRPPHRCSVRLMRRTSSVGAAAARPAMARRFGEQGVVVDAPPHQADPLGRRRRRGPRRTSTMAAVAWGPTPVAASTCGRRRGGGRAAGSGVESRRAAGDAHVAGQRQVHAGADGRAVDRGDGRAAASGRPAGSPRRCRAGPSLGLRRGGTGRRRRRTPAARR